MDRVYFITGKKHTGYDYDVVSLVKDLIHSRKVINRLSRKIQKLKQENNYLWIGYKSMEQCIESKTNYNFELINRIFKAIKIMEDYTLFDLKAEKVMEVINILGGKQ